MEVLGLFWLWVLGSALINVLGFFIKIKVPLYKGKWDRNKKSPIYKMEKNKYRHHYSVYKYNIDYNCYCFLYDNTLLILYFVFLLPFSCWFVFPYYEKKDTGYGTFNKEELENIYFDLGGYWEFENDKYWTKYNKEIEIENKEKDILNNLNKDFNKHYNNE